MGIFSVTEYNGITHRLLRFSITFVTFVFSLVFNIFLSIFVCVAASLFFA